MGKLTFLKTDHDFAAFKESKSFQGQGLKIRVRFRTDQNNPRFGFIVPKKIMPKVVDRNLVKRRIKYILSQISSKLKPVDIVFYPNKGLVQKKFSELDAEVNQLLSKAKLWKP